MISLYGYNSSQVSVVPSAILLIFDVIDRESVITHAGTAGAMLDFSGVLEE